MGKKQGGEMAREFVVKVPMHCRCIGCRKKLRDAVRGLRWAAGVLTVCQSAAVDAEELGLLATADPELLRELVQDAMGKKVHLVFPPNKGRPGAGAGDGTSGKDDPRLVDAAALQALVDDLQRQAPQLGRRLHDGLGAADHHHHQQQQPGPDWNSYGTAYPWLPSYYPGPPAPAWEAYGHPLPAPAPPGHYLPSAPRWPGGPGF